MSISIAPAGELSLALLELVDENMMDDHLRGLAQDCHRYVSR